MDSSSNSMSRNWVLIAMAAVALTAIGVGGWLSLQSVPPPPDTAAATGETKPEKLNDPSAIEEPEATVRGRKSPEKFGFPSYPTAVDFQSMEIGKDQGSSAYAVKRGTSAEIARFYIEKLGALGWQFQWKRDAEVHPKDLGKTVDMKGARVRWVQRRTGRQLTLLALDDPQQGRTAQAVLSWSKLPPRARR